MLQNTLTIQSTITSQLMRRALFKGFIIALAGILLLVLASVFIPLSEMKIWGWSLFPVSLTLVTFGLLPYKRLCRLQMKPSELNWMDSNYLTYSSKGKKILKLPLQSIARMSYIRSPSSYGIAIWLKPSLATQLLIFQPSHEVKEQRRQRFLNVQPDLFFSYFNERAFNELMEWQKEDESIPGTSEN